MTAQVEPFSALVELAERSVSNAKGLPAQVNIVPHWSGIGFLLGGQRMVAPMGEVAEILKVPGSTRLPGVQTWVRGVSNVRGRLLPLIDLEAFFSGSLSRGRNRNRVLVLEMGELYSGLIVSEVYGMQHFPVDTFTDEVPDGVDTMRPFLAGSYALEDANWTVFSPFRLAQDETFFNAAAN